MYFISNLKINFDNNCFDQNLQLENLKGENEFHYNNFLNYKDSINNYCQLSQRSFIKGFFFFTILVGSFDLLVGLMGVDQGNDSNICKLQDSIDN